MDELFMLGSLAEIVETAIYTGFLKDAIPLSLILVGPSGTAKSKLLKRYEYPSTHITDSITSMGLFEIARKDEKNEKRFIIMPDMNPTLNRKASTAQSTMSNLLSITGDGTVRIDDGRSEKTAKHDVMGLLTACTPDVYEKHARHWFAIGLRRRILPIFFTYTSETQKALQKLVRADRIHGNAAKPAKLKLPKAIMRVKMPSAIANEIEIASSTLARNLGKLSFIDSKIKKWQVREVIPISPHVILRVLAMAHALKRGAQRVTKEDEQFINRFIDFTDPEKVRQI